jgi:hypothetical protein
VDNIKIGLRDVRIKSVHWFCGIVIGALVNMAVGSEKERDSIGK